MLCYVIAILVYASNCRRIADDGQTRNDSDYVLQTYTDNEMKGRFEQRGSSKN